MPQKSWPMTEMRITIFGPARRSSRSVKIATSTPPPRLVDGVHVGRREGDRQQHEPAEDRRVEDRAARRPWRRARGAVGLLGDVRAGVEAGDRVHASAGSRAAARRTRTCPSPKPELLMRSVKTKSALAWWSGTKIEHAMITATPSDVPPHRDAVEAARRGGDEKMLISGVQREDDDEERRRSRPSEVAVGEVDEARSRSNRLKREFAKVARGVVDRGGDRDEADQVEPAREPAPARARRAWPPTSRCRRPSDRPTTSSDMQNAMIRMRDRR